MGKLQKIQPTASQREYEFANNLTPKQKGELNIITGSYDRALSKAASILKEKLGIDIYSSPYSSNSAASSGNNSKLSLSSVNNLPIRNISKENLSQE